ncbi:EAL domain-containing protein [Acetobacter lambici]|uniref:EAL domain-containing protein n=1 Tax=Acetobacter lambici TaxID=1332824 RepID=A0ABT1EYV9_9PROT|nr:EAL domain-containing protein [Acetobacter lambici]MCP1242188.1 EAL domain-containing protein [Acetobacter lambici]MCP1258128.1 EAL domain-containing protein [Acetobacter lambici]NHO56018.1 EAL domain-containing protein [Acetobacter lambici]
MSETEHDILLPEHCGNMYYEILKQAADGVIIINEDNNIIFFNTAAERLWGYAASEVMGQNVKCLVPFEHRAKHDDYIAHNRATGIDRIVGTSREITFTRSAGDYAVAEMSVSAITLAPLNKRYYMAIVKGVTEESHRKKLITLQNKVFTELAGKATEQDIADMLCAEAEKLVLNSVAVLLQITPERGLEILSGESLPRRKGRMLTRMTLPEADMVALRNHPEEARTVVWQNAGAVEQEVGLLDCWASTVCDGTGTPIGIFALYSRNRDKITNWPQKIVSGCVPSCAAIIERGKNRQKLNRLDRYDSLTGLLNRNAVTIILKNMMAQQPNGWPFALLVLDIDLFQDINNLLGYDQGDLLLQIVAQRLNAQCRSNFVTGRLGGDDFVIIIPGGDRNTASSFAETLIEVMHEPIIINGHELIVSISTGISLYPDESKDVEQVLNRAEVAMLEAKKMARGSFRILDNASDSEVQSRLIVGSALRKAIQHSELLLFYQPQICVTTGKLHGVEALARWQHPVLGAVPPSRFIPIAEETGQIEAIGRWSIAEACQQLAQWDQLGIMVPVVSVNISAGHFASSELLQQIVDVLDAYNLTPDRLTIEITESVMMRQSSEALATLSAIRGIGVGLSLDDFGTGFSSLSRLSTLPLTELKIDRSFVMNFEENISSLIVTEAAITIGKRLGVRIVTEGVEDDSQEKMLRSMGCDVMQGYLFGRPMPPAALNTWIMERSLGKNGVMKENSRLKN